MLMYNNVYRLLIVSGLEYNNFSSVEMKEKYALIVMIMLWSWTWNFILR